MSSSVDVVHLTCRVSLMGADGRGGIPPQQKEVNWSISSKKGIKPEAVQLISTLDHFK